MSTETLTRRLTAISQALVKGAGSANWDSAEIIMGYERMDSAMSQSRRLEVNRGIRDRLEAESLRGRHVIPERAGPAGLTNCVQFGGLPGNSDTPPAVPDYLNAKQKKLLKKGKGKGKDSAGGGDG